MTKRDSLWPESFLKRLLSISDKKPNWTRFFGPDMTEKKNLQRAFEPGKNRRAGRVWWLIKKEKKKQLTIITEHIIQKPGMAVVHVKILNGVTTMVTSQNAHHSPIIHRRCGLRRVLNTNIIIIIVIIVRRMNNDYALISVCSSFSFDLVASCNLFWNRLEGLSCSRLYIYI